jgi:hypothetical protein
VAKEILAVPEEQLAAVVAIIRAGLAATPDAPERARRRLTCWCDDMDDYLKEREGRA